MDSLYKGWHSSSLKRELILLKLVSCVLQHIIFHIEVSVATKQYNDDLILGEHDDIHVEDDVP